MYVLDASRRRIIRLRCVTDWATVASLATAGGTLVLAVATFGFDPFVEPVGQDRRARRPRGGAVIAGRGHRRVITFAVIRAASSDAR